MLLLISEIIWAIGVIGWFLIRLPHQRRSRKTPISKSARTPRERASLAISTIALGPLPALFVFTDWLAFADHRHHWSMLVIGTLCFTVSLWLFRLTHQSLGRHWSVSLDLREGHKLVTDGIYKYVRHPMYLAAWLWAVAQFFLLPNWIAGLSGIIGFGLLYFQRVGKEEQMMEAAFGEDYRDYMEHTGRIFPKIK